MLTKNQIDAIPNELKLLKQWVGAENKIPMTPKSQAAASVTDPSTWGSFDDAVSGIEDGKYTHIGFVFTEQDPYVFIDLDPAKENGKPLPNSDPRFQEQDQKNLSWVKAFGSYTERSQSGLGYHVIIKAHLAQAIKLPGTEMYFAKRYAIFTGDVLELLPISERQAELDQITAALKITSHRAKTGPSFNGPQDYDDQTILNKLAVAANAASIRELWEGKWQGHYPSQSEADHALLSHICFYTKNNEQVARLFRMSALGLRAKANNPRDPYVETSITHIRNNQPAPIDFSSFNKFHAQAQVKLAPPPKTYPKPPGVLAEIADFIYGAAIHPVHEVSYAGAISFAAGLTGRHFNVSGTGLNLYTLLLAATGLGKEGASDGIDLLYTAIRPRIPEIETFRGPSNFASGAGLVRNLSEKTFPCALSVIGEFGLRLTAMSMPNANAAEIGLRSALLDFFSKSGDGKTLSPVAYSDSTKNTNLIQSPALSILGVSTPETFFSKLTETSISDGLIPRFLAIAYEGECKVSNKKRNQVPSHTLIDKLCKLAETVIYMSRNNSFCHIPLDNKAQHRFDLFEEHIVSKMNNFPDGAIRNILNRAHLKALRLAGIAAACDNPSQPQITMDHASWAIDFVEVDCAYMLGRFEQGYVGEGDNRQINTLRDKIKLILHKDTAPVKNPTWARMIDKNVIPHSMLSQRFLSNAAFAQDKRGASSALNATIKTLIDNGELREVPAPQLHEMFSATGKAYLVIGMV